VDRILVIEDDPRIQKSLRRLFSAEGCEVNLAENGRTGLDHMKTSAPAAVILDLMLPDASGHDLCKTIKASSPETPVIILSAVSEIADKVLLFELGADDYVTKPFSPRELLARVQAAVRRLKKPHNVKTFSFADIVIDFRKMEAIKAGTPIPLTAFDFKLLRFLVENADRLLSREELLNNVWGYNCYPSTRTVDNQILKLRQKVEVDPSNPRHIRTLHGMGYKFVF
jgi:DNA-binding response OmpR family regulator